MSSGPDRPSLRRRLGLLLALSLVVLLAAEAAGLRLFPRSLVQGYVITRLDHDADTLYARIADSPGGVLPADLSPGVVYDTPLSGHYYRVVVGSSVTRSRSLWDTDFEMPLLSPGERRIDFRTGPAGQELLVLSRGYALPQDAMTLVVAEDIGEMKRRIERFERLFLIALIVAFAVMALVQQLIVWAGLRPLKDVVRACRAVERGETGRLDAENAPSEIAPVLEAVDRLVRHHGRRTARTRHALGNLAHALKTPLAALAQAADDLESRGDGEAAETLRRQIGAMRNTVERELRRASLAGPGAPGTGFDMASELAALAESLGRLHDGRVLIEVDAPPGERFPADPDDLLELFGNLLDNACKWARRRVRITAGDGGGLHAVIEDDGPGVPEENLSRLGEVGLRLDESRPGHGLGLAIARDVVAQYGGTIGFGRSAELGGLRVEVSIPRP